METKFLLVNSLAESLVLSVFDYNDHRKNSELGFATFDMAKLREDATWEGVEQSVLKDGKEKGLLRFDISFFPVLKPDLTGTEPLPDSSECVHQQSTFSHSRSILQRSASSALLFTKPRILTVRS